MCQNLLTVVAPKCLDGIMIEYLGKLHALLHDFNELLSLASTPTQELKQWSKFFMLLGLHGLLDDYSHVRDQILGSPVVPNFTSTYSTLLRVPSKHITDIPLSVDDSFALTSQRYDCTRPSKLGKRRHKCDYCGKLGHKLIGVMPYMAVLLNLLRLPKMFPCTLLPWTLLHLIYLVNLQFSMNFLNGMRVVKTLVPLLLLHIEVQLLLALLTQNSLGPWVFDSSATDHITGNKYFFSSLSTFGYLPTITMANSSRVSSHGVGTIHLLPSLSIDSVLYVPGSPFNLLSNNRLTCSLDCVISFTKDSICLQDRSSRRVIDTGCKSHGLFHLRTSAHVGTVMDSPSLIHAQLGHPSLAKMQHLVPSLSKVSSLSCESCHLGKQSSSSFPSSVSQRASFPFALVHYDIWGPSHVKSNLGFQYFVTFIDDYSICTWLFLMKSCSKLFSTF